MTRGAPPGRRPLLPRLFLLFVVTIVILQPLPPTAVTASVAPAVFGPAPPTPARAVARERVEAAARLVTEAQARRGNGKNLAPLRRALELDPWNVRALLALGTSTMVGPDPTVVDTAFTLMARAFHPDARPGPLDVHVKQGWYLATIIGRRAIEEQRFEQARRFLDLAATSRAVPDDCTAMQAATLLTGFPKSVAHARAAVDTYISRVDALLSRGEDEDVDGDSDGAGDGDGDPQLLDLSGTDDEDPYVFCILTAFFHEIYYEADLALTMGKHFALTVRAFPEYVHVARHLRGVSPHRTLMASGALFSQRQNRKNKNTNKRKIRLGIASAHFYPFNSVIDVISNLPRDRFDVTFVYFNEQHPIPNTTPFLQRMWKRYGNRALVFSKTESGWLDRARDEVAGLKLDLLLYLDGTMAKMCRRIAMSRLARVQAVSHGHPVTTGIPRNIMQFYVSWAAAELPLEESRHHYTEELALLPGNTMHQYYEPRVLRTKKRRRQKKKKGAGTKNAHERRAGDDEDGEDMGFVLKSAADGKRFSHITREYFRDALLARPEGFAYTVGLVPGFDVGGGGGGGSGNGGRKRRQHTPWRWYTCMQKPFKRHPEFDSMVAGVLARDPGGVVMMHGTPGNPEATQIMWDRLAEQGADMSRVHFIPPQPHHALMALYALSDVILDSYYAGGCTTTREALELSAPVVTLPASHLGGRWSLAYYSIMGVMDLVAKDKEDYVTIAVRMGTDRTARRAVKKRIRNNLAKLFGRKEAVGSWATLLERIANAPEAEEAEEAGMAEAEL